MQIPTRSRSWMTACCLLAGPLFQLEAWAGSAPEEIWQGAFRTQSVWGAMELRLSIDGQQWRARLRFTPRGQEVEPQLRQLEASPKRLSFVTDLAGTEYRFTGARQGNHWEGALVPVVAGKQPGKWSLIALPSSRELRPATLPEPSGQYTV